MSKSSARIDYWAKGIAPSHELRRWYQHDPPKWPEFRRRYFAELESNPGSLAELRSYLGDGTATLVFSSTEAKLNNASALQEFLEAH